MANVQAKHLAIQKHAEIPTPEVLLPVLNSNEQRCTAVVSDDVLIANLVTTRCISHKLIQ